ncbi:ABC transporter ATP-binding protein [Pelagibacterium montanilacus]|uniref:ABC transporter ATP-binding protein n=1 Tax=Pelagibacterium montanilacus TaxID=2185280 RepID=UPI000F8F38E8|nr:ABC transporter ATP-binding protein [Pelagibacterium montanilacus]
MSAQTAPLLEVDGLRVDFASRAGLVQAINEVSLVVHKGETLGLVGESGSGKSVSAQAVMGLISPPGAITGGDVRWCGTSLLGRKGERYARSVRGKNIAMIFQDPMTSLNPLMTVGDQIGEAMRYHLGFTHVQARRRAEELLGAVGLSAPARRLDQYPHELSGGMRQRVMIAMAISCEPELLIADEPTTALDVTIQAQILELLARLQKELGLAIILITHDLGVVAGICNRVAVMYAGRIVETGDVDTIFEDPGHPYTQGLLRSTPSLEGTEDTLMSIDGIPPRLIDPQPGCPFLPRCPIGVDACRQAPPAEAWKGSAVRCWKAGADAWSMGATRAQEAGL